MGHLLASINSDAAEAIRDEPKPNLPPIGGLVVYTMRPGHGRNGSNKFPAIVMKHGPRGTLGLMVIIDAGDMADEDLVEPAGPGQEFHCWERVEDDHAGIGFIRSALFDNAMLVTKLAAEVQALKTMLMGDFKAPPIPLFQIFADMEKRLKAIESKKDGK